MPKRKYAPKSDYPLFAFDVIVLVDVDPEDWVPPTRDVIEETRERANGFIDAFTDEIYDDQIREDIIRERGDLIGELANDDEPFLIWATSHLQYSFFIESNEFVKIIVNGIYTDSKHTLEACLRGISATKGRNISVAFIGINRGNAMNHLSHHIHQFPEFDTFLIEKYYFPIDDFMSLDDVIDNPWAV